MLNPNLSLKDSISDFMQTWANLQKDAKKSEQDKKTYIWFLQETKKTFSKLYSQLEKKEWLELTGDIIKLASCKLKENVIYYNSKIMKKIEDMTNEELREAFKKGKVWLLQHSEVIGTTKTELGEEYNHEEFMKGLDRLELIENELQKRGETYD
jgi:hypothetical protein